MADRPPPSVDPTPAEAMVTIRQILGIETSSHRATIAAVEHLHASLAPWREVEQLMSKTRLHPKEVVRRVHAAVLHLGQLLGALRAGDTQHDDVIAALRHMVGDHKRLQDAAGEVHAIRAWRTHLERELRAAGLPSASVSPIVLATCLVHIAAPCRRPGQCGGSRDGSGPAGRPRGAPGAAGAAGPVRLRPARHRHGLDHNPGRVGR